MIAFLETRPLPLPTVAPEAPADETHGAITLDFPRGELLLENEAKQAFRLTWSEAQGPRERALAPGNYTLRSYRLLRERAGVEWHVSATAPSIRKLRLRAGETARIELDPTIAIRPVLREHQAGMTITGSGKAGLSIYKNGRRIPIGYRVLDGQGSAIASGSMRYG